ncbi:Uncharacterized protein GBIM_19817 [Gryllus bimaculatus]|nr:Uncharacterized protein GBIM_19817 [Gryllus bimaculatus]
MRFDTTRYDATRHDTTRHDTTRHAAPRRATPRHAAPRRATPRHATPRHATPRQHLHPRGEGFDQTRRKMAARVARTASGLFVSWHKTMQSENSTLCSLAAPDCLLLPVYTDEKKKLLSVCSATVAFLSVFIDLAAAVS